MSLSRVDIIPDEDQALMEEFDALIKQIGSDFVDFSIKPVLLDIVTRLEEAVTRASETVEEGIKRLTIVIANTDLGEALQKVADHLVMLEKVTSDVVNEHQLLVKNSTEMRTEYADIVADVTRRIPDVAKHLEQITALHARIQDLVGSLEANVSTSAAAFSDIRSRLDDVGNYARDQVEKLGVVARLIDAVRDALVKGNNSINTSLDSLNTTVASLMKKVSVIESVMNQFAEALTSYESQLKALSQSQAKMRSELSGTIDQLAQGLDLQQKWSQELFSCIKNQLRLTWLILGITVPLGIAVLWPLISGYLFR